MPDYMTRFLCPGCGKRLKVSPSAAGRTVNCPKCGMAVIVPPADPETEGSPEPHPLPPFTAQSSRSPAHRPKPRATNLVIPLDDEGAVAPRHASSSPVAGVSNLIVVQQPSRAAHSLGIASLVVGVLSVIVCCVPGLGMLISGLVDLPDFPGGLL
jgi:hypothetical protein